MEAHQAIFDSETDFTEPNSSAVSTPPSRVVGSYGLGSSRDEMNLAEFPLAVLSTRTNPNIKTLEFSDSQRMRSGEVIERKWIITGADKFGLPTATDDDVILGLICLTKEQGFRERKVYFTRYELLKILRWTTEGRSYSRLTKSLDRLSGVRIRASNAFFDNTLKAYQTRNFGIIDAYEINDERSSSKAPNSYFIWSESMFNSFKSGYIKKIDLDFYFKLKSSVSRRLYRYLDKHFYYKQVVEKSLTALAFEKLGLARTYKYVSSIKQQIAPACDELISIGFLDNAEFYGRGEGTMVRFSKKSEISSIPSPKKVTAQTEYVKQPEIQIRAPELTTRDSNLESALVQRGLTSGQVKHLLSQKTATDLERIKQILTYFDSMVSVGDPKVSRNPVGFLYRAVESPYRFIIPTEKASSQKSQQKVKSSRPELKVVNSRAKEAPEIVARKSQYQAYLSERVSKYRIDIGSERLQHLYGIYEQKMSCLKSILDASKYREAVEGLVRDEIIKTLGLPSFETWQQQQIPGFN